MNVCSMPTDLIDLALDILKDVIVSVVVEIGLRYTYGDQRGGGNVRGGGGG